MIKINVRGSFSKTDKFLKKMYNLDYRSILRSYGERGVLALEAATPANTGTTSKSWSYSIDVSRTQTTISWRNSNTSGGIPVVILLQYGHGTRNGGYVQGIDFINPALKPIFKDIADAVWREVTSG